MLLLRVLFFGASLLVTLCVLIGVAAAWFAVLPEVPAVFATAICWGVTVLASQEASLALARRLGLWS